MTGADFITGLLALRAWQDGRDEGLNGMLGVAFVVRNRVRAGWHGGDWIQVLSHHREWLAHEEQYPEELPDTRAHSFQLLLQDITGVFNGSRKDDITVTRADGASVLALPPPPALYYMRLNTPNPRLWFIENITRATDKHKLIAQVGLLAFWT